MRRRSTALAALCTLLAASSGPAYGDEQTGDPSGAAVAFRLGDERIAESSGLAASALHPGVVWTINDSGDSARVFAIGRRGRTVAVIRLAGQEPRDWEAITPGRDADGRPALFVGDIGDNSVTRDRGILVHVVPEPETLGDATLDVTSYRLRYPDGPADAETLLVDPETNRLYVVTKGLLGGAIYAAPERLDPDAPNTLQRIDSAPSLVTDGSYLPDGRYVLRDYYGAYLYGGDGALESRFDLPTQDQGESLTFTADGAAVLVGSEGEDSEVWRVPLPGGTSAPAATPAPSASPGDDASTASDAGTADGGEAPDDAAAAQPYLLLVGGGLLLLLFVAVGWLVARRR